MCVEKRAFMALKLYVRNRQIVRALTIAIFISLIGCAFQNSDQLVDELSSKGITIVTKDQRYLASTQFIERESQLDDHVKAFILDTGYPSAISVSSSFLSPTSARLYYPTPGNYFDFTKSDSGWLITGPFSLSEAEVEELQKVSIMAEANSSTVVPEPPTIEKVEETPSIDETTLISKPASEEKNTKVTVPVAGFSSPAQTTQAPEAHLSQEAETTPKGDLVHYVTYSGETLSMIARWYTNERENAGKIGRLNKLKNADQLEIGDVLVVPSYLVKNKKRFTESALESLKGTIKSETAAIPVFRKTESPATPTH